MNYFLIDDNIINIDTNLRFSYSKLIKIDLKKQQLLFNLFTRLKYSSLTIWKYLNILFYREHWKRFYHLNLYASHQTSDFYHYPEEQWINS